MILSLAVFSCKTEPVEPIAGQVTLEGIVASYQAPPAIGGECDPSGYVLLTTRWVTGEPSYSYDRVYLENGQSASYVAQKVRVAGTLDSIFAGGVVTPRRKFPLIHVTRIQTMLY